MCLYVDCVLVLSIMLKVLFVWCGRQELHNLVKGKFY